MSSAFAHAVAGFM